MARQSDESGQSGRVFISHSSQDKPFVRRLVADLIRADLKVWIDERELKVGDSIVANIEEGLKDTDYLVIVLSEHSVQSRWVRAELDAALMNELSGRGTVVLPVRIDDCEIPPLLEPRVFADFRDDYDAGLAQLLTALDNEARTGSEVVAKEDAEQPATRASAPVASKCMGKLAQVSLGDLRRRMCDRLERSEVGDVWFDTFGGDQMDDAYPDRPKSECVRGLIDRARKRGLFSQLLRELCGNRPDLGDESHP